MATPSDVLHGSSLWLSLCCLLQTVRQEVASRTPRHGLQGSLRVFESFALRCDSPMAGEFLSSELVLPVEERLGLKS